MSRILVRLATAFLLVFGVAGVARGQVAAVDLELVLAVDASGSVNQQRFELQKQGYVAAFRDLRVVQAIGAGPHRSIAVTLVQWTGPEQHVQIAEWTKIDNAETARGFAAAIEGAPRQLFGGGTSVSGAIDYAMSLFPTSPYHGDRRIIDVSGDGANNRGRPAARARDEAVKAGVAINGLPILAVEPALDKWYRDNVIGGPGAFLIAAQSYEDFAAAILTKLVSEIADRRNNPAPRAAAKVMEACLCAPPTGALAPPIR